MNFTDLACYVVPQVQELMIVINKSGQIQMIIAIYKNKQAETKRLEEFKGNDALLYLGQAIQIIDKMKRHRIALNTIQEDTLVLDSHQQIWISDLSDIRSFKKNQQLYIDLNKLNPVSDYYQSNKQP